jgi:hypothetical protein
VDAAAALKRLNRLRWQYGPDLAAERLALLRVLARGRLARAADVRELHELLCILHAYPDDRAVFDQVARMLAAFDARRDLRRHRDALVDTGIAGTATFYRFEAPTARWLAERWGRCLTVDWDEVDAERVARHLALLSLDAERPGLDEPPIEGRRWLDRLRGSETDAAFLIRRAASLEGAPPVRDRVYDELGLMLRLAPGPDTPSRTRARYERSAFVPQPGPVRQRRAGLRVEAATPPRAVREVTARDGAALIDLAREAMVTRSRDLHAFEHASPLDVRLIDCGDGLELACIGVEPAHRHLLEAVYGFLILQNGVPIGYALTSALFRSSEIAFNIFETYRHAEAARIFGRLLGTTRALFGSDTFTIFPYQLGHGNEEGIESGAWWFYYKLGFRPRDPAAWRLARREVGRVRRRSSYRSSAATLSRLARHNVFFDLGERRDDVMGTFAGDAVGLAATDCLSRRFGSDRARATRTCADEVARLLALQDWRRLPAAERLAWMRLSPLILLLPGVARWSAADRHALAALARAKGGRRENAFVLLANRHARFHRALARLGRWAAARAAVSRRPR